jgi:hypothetical protein
LLLVVPFSLPALISHQRRKRKRHNEKQKAVKGSGRLAADKHRQIVDERYAAAVEDYEQGQTDEAPAAVRQEDYAEYSMEQFAKAVKTVYTAMVDEESDRVTEWKGEHPAQRSKKGRKKRGKKGKAFSSAVELISQMYRYLYCV